MKKKQFLALTLVLLLVLSACGAKSEASREVADGYAYETTEAAYEEEVYAVEAPAAMGTAAVNLSDNGEVKDKENGEDVKAEEKQDYAEKIIYSGHVYIETTAFDQSLSKLDETVSAFGGFVQDSSVSGTSNGDRTAVIDRYAYYVVRIPSARFNEFMTLTGTLGNVTSSGKNAENVTSQYTDNEARLESLHTQEDRLMDMLGKSGDLESLIALEQRLADVRYETESIERNLRNLDQRLAYSTVNIDLIEVENYTATVTVQRTFGEKFIDAAKDGWNGFVTVLEGLILLLITCLPTLILIAVIVFIIVLIIRKAKKRKAKKKAAKEETVKEETAKEQTEKEE